MPNHLRLPETIQTGTPSNLQPLAYYGPLQSQQDFEPESPAVPFSHYLWMLKRHRWEIVAFVVACVLATVPNATGVRASAKVLETSVGLATGFGFALIYVTRSVISRGIHV